MKARIAAREATNKGTTAGASVTRAQGGGERLPGMLEVHVSRPEELDQKLQEAIDVVSRTAAHHHIGVLVTPTGAGRYIVRAHPAVPRGLVRQQSE